MSSRAVRPGSRITSPPRCIFTRTGGRKDRHAELAGRIGTGSPGPVVVLAIDQHARNVGRGNPCVEKHPARLWLAGGVYEDTNVIGAIRRHLRGEGKRRIVAGNKSVIAPVVKKLQCVAGTVNQSN